MLLSKAHLAVKNFILEKEKGRGRNQKANIPQNRKIPEKTAVKKVHQQKRAAPLTEEIEKETVQDSDGFEEKAASSKVKREKEIGRQVLGNDKLTADSGGAVETETVLDEDDAEGKLPLESNAVLKTMPTEKSLTKKAAQKKREAMGEKKASGILKEAILKAAIKAGNQLGEDGLVSYLEAQALKNASSFLTLLGKVLPAELNSEGQELKTVTKIELVALSPSPKDLTVAKSPTGKKRTTSKKRPARHQELGINQELSEILKKDD